MAIFIDENMLHCPNADCRGIEFEKVVIKAFNVGPKNKEFAKTMLLEANSRVLLKCIKCGQTIDTKDYDLRELNQG